MKQEDKQLLVKNLCAMLPYGVKATTTSNGWNGIYTITGYANDRIYLDCPVYDKGDDEWLVEFVKPYLRPMSSMTEEEKEECNESLRKDVDVIIDAMKRGENSGAGFYKMDFLYSHHFDYCGLIPMGLALEAPEGMYKF